MLSDEEKRRFDSITQNIGLSSDETPSDLHHKSRVYLFVVLLFIAGLAGIIAGVYFKNIISGVAGFTCMMISAYRATLMLFSRRE